MRRFLGISFGLATHGLFAVTVWYLYWFLKGSESPRLEGSYFIWDALSGRSIYGAAQHPAAAGRARSADADRSCSLLRLLLLRGHVLELAIDVCQLAFESRP